MRFGEPEGARPAPFLRTFAQVAIVLSPLVLLELKRGLPVLLGMGFLGPDPLLVGVAFAALRCGRTAACTLAAVSGLLMDVPAGTPFGLGALRLAFLAAVLCSLRTELDGKSWLVRPFAVLLLAVAEKFLEALVLAASLSSPLLPLLLQASLVALETAALTPLLWPAAEALVAASSGRRARAPQGSF